MSCWFKHNWRRIEPTGNQHFRAQSLGIPLESPETDIPWDYVCVDCKKIKYRLDEFLENRLLEEKICREARERVIARGKPL